MGKKKGKGEGLSMSQAMALVGSSVPSAPPMTTSFVTGAGIPLGGEALRQARRQTLIEQGLLRPKKKYQDTEERKEAAKKRREERRAKKRAALEAKGLGPKPKAKYGSKEERKEASKERRKDRRIKKKTFLVEMAKANPEAAQRFGIDISRFKIGG